MVEIMTFFRTGSRKFNNLYDTHHIIFIKYTKLKPGLLASISSFQPSKWRERQGRKSESQFMPNICALTANKSGNGSCVPGNLHSKSSAKKSKTKSTNCTPSERQQLLFTPRIKIIPVQISAPEDKMLLKNDNNVYHGPVPDDAEERLKSCFGEESCRTASNYNGSYKSQRNKHNSRDAKGPWSKVLCMHSERIIVGDVVLYNLSEIIMIGVSQAYRNRT